MSRFDHIAPDALFKQLERATPDESLPAVSTLLAAVRFNSEGLLPAIAQQHDTQEVLMMAWMSPPMHSDCRASFPGIWQ